MKLFTTILMMANFAVSLSAFAQAGNGAGNGGGIQSCLKRPIGQQFIAYDLKEIQDHIISQRRRKVSPADATLTKEQYFNAAIEKVRKLSPRLADAIVRANTFYQANVGPSGKFKLDRVPDVSLYSIDDDCTYEQLVNWIEPEQMFRAFGVRELHILRNEVMYAGLTAQSQAASDFHEAAYRVRRAFKLDNDTGSNFVRLLTGQAFGEGEIDKDLLTKIALYDQYSDEKGYRLIVSSLPCDETPRFVVTNTGTRVVTESRRDLWGQWERTLTLKPGASKTINLPVLVLDLDQGGVFGNFGRSVDIVVTIDLSACGEVFHLRDYLSAGSSTTNVRIRWMSSPL